MKIVYYLNVSNYELYMRSSKVPLIDTLYVNGTFTAHLFLFTKPLVLVPKGLMNIFYKLCLMVFNFIA